MEPHGFERKIDQLGRLVLPSEMRRALSLKRGDAIEITLFGQYILLRKPQAAPADAPAPADNNPILCEARGWLGELGASDLALAHAFLERLRG